MTDNSYKDTPALKNKRTISVDRNRVTCCTAHGSSYTGTIFEHSGLEFQFL